MSAAVIWDVTVVSDLPQALLNRVTSHMSTKRALLDACRAVDSMDLKTVRLDVFREGVTGLLIEAFPERKYLAAYNPVQVRAHACPECMELYYDEPHPDNGCRLGAVEGVLSS